MIGRGGSISLENAARCEEENDAEDAVVKGCDDIKEFN
jgi:hypothetical protein